MSCLPFPHSNAISAFSSHVCCCVMSNFSNLLFHATVPCLLFHTPMLCLLLYAVAPCLFFSMLFHCIYFFLHCIYCCLMSTLSTLLRHVSFFHAAAPCLLFPPSCTLSTFPHCCVMPTFSMRVPCLLCTLLCCVYFLHIAELVLLFPSCCAMSTLSTLLCHVYFFFNAAAPCPLFLAAATFLF